MKNCGHRFHVLVANRDFIDGVLVKIISPKNNPPTIVQDKVLALIQVHSFHILLPEIRTVCFSTKHAVIIKNVAGFLYVKTIYPDWQGRADVHTHRFFTEGEVSGF